MNHPQSKALEIATQIVVAKIASDSTGMNTASGALVGEYFKAIYDKVLEITKTITD